VGSMHFVALQNRTERKRQETILVKILSAHYYITSNWLIDGGFVDKQAT